MNIPEPSNRFEKALFEAMEEKPAAKPDVEPDLIGEEMAREDAAEALRLAKIASADAASIRAKYEALAAQPAASVPMRTAPRVDAARRAAGNAVAALEKALTATTHPETIAYLKEQLAFAKAAR